MQVSEQIQPVNFGLNPRAALTILKYKEHR